MQAPGPIAVVAAAVQPFVTPGLIAGCAWLGKTGFTRVMRAIDSLGDRVSALERTVTIIHTACFGPTGASGIAGDNSELRQFNHDQRSINARTGERLDEHDRRLGGHDDDIRALREGDR
jgi:hypothetical protein